MVKLLCLLLFWGFSIGGHASDHADPIITQGKNQNITGMFFFPDKNNLILIFTVSPGLTEAQPYSLENIKYVLNMDLHSSVNFNDPANNARYGGTIEAPSNISPDVTITFGFDITARINMEKIEGLNNVEQIEIYSGINDDPFIFPRFFKKNVIATALRIPLSSFPLEQETFLLWAQTFIDGRQIDHVGRSNRTQLARFDFLNTLLPAQHLNNITTKKEQQHNLADFLHSYKETTPLFGLFQYIFELRQYDAQPDVMIYSRSKAAQFPNGRKLTDDVAAITCAVGDCILQEISFIEGGFPRDTVNDKPFLTEFPYLAAPWPSMEQANTNSIFSWWGVYLLIILNILLIGLFAWFFYILGQRSVKK